MALIQAISSWFPAEIISEVILASPRGDRAAFCRVSKLFHNIGVPVLYRVVNLPWESRDAFSRTILSNPFLAGLVRSLSIEHNPRSGKPKFHTKVLTQMLNSFQMLINLEHLSIIFHLWCEQHYRAFVQWSFPRLVSCHLGLSSTQSNYLALMSSFLQHHSSIRSFSSPLTGTSDKYEALPAPCSLPYLRNFRGAAPLVPLILDAQDLSEVMLSLGRKRSAQDVEKIIHTLESMTRDGTPFICSNDDCEESFIEILDSISRNLPQTKTLQMRGCVPNKENLVHLQNCLPPFARLLFLSVIIDHNRDLKNRRFSDMGFEAQFKTSVMYVPASRLVASTVPLGGK
ncbi:hypothetical protein B0H19DRAFT_290407 [Mycena capillaripes]|nr:hypothetical protein B0H19DRAFT_290407 [Mycena capillaripes]